jgi:Uncharacterised protein conserved in bacteria (DUF2336)
MTASALVELVADVADAVSSRSADRRVLMLRRATHLYLSYAHRLSEHQIELFDDVLVKLVDCVEPAFLMELSAGLAALPQSPRRTLRFLACHPVIAVASPVLLRSPAFCDEDLHALARELDIEHLALIAGRQILDEDLTDILLLRGDAGICRALARNAGARFSARGFASLVGLAVRTQDIAEVLALRPDIPRELLRQLLLELSDEVRLRLLKAALPHSRQSIREVLDDIARHVSTNAPEPVVYSDARARVIEFSKTGRLNDSAVNGFALRREYTNIIAALTVMSGAALETIEPLLEEKGCEGLVVACRAARLNWTTALAIIRSRNVPQLSDSEIARARDEFQKLHLSNAQWKIRFGSTSKPSSDRASA